MLQSATYGSGDDIRLVGGDVPEQLAFPNVQIGRVRRENGRIHALGIHPCLGEGAHHRDEVLQSRIRRPASSRRIDSVELMHTRMKNVYGGCMHELCDPRPWDGQHLILFVAPHAVRAPVGGT